MSGMPPVLRPTRRPDPIPNVLADEATPNRLSTQLRPPNEAPASRGPRATATVLPTAPARPAVGADSRFESRPRRGISPTRVIAIVFLVLTAIRFIGAVSGRPDSPIPTVTIDYAEAAELGPGAMEFGQGSDGACGISGVSGTFRYGAHVWWGAHLARQIVGAETLTVVAVHNGIEIDRQRALAATVGPLQGGEVLCAGSPRTETQPGGYLLKIVDDSGRVLASGEYEVTG